MKQTKIAPMIIVRFLFCQLILLVVRGWFQNRGNSLSTLGPLPTCHSFSTSSSPSLWKRRSNNAFDNLQTPPIQRNTVILAESPKSTFQDGFANLPVEEMQQRLVQKGLGFQQTTREEEPGMARVPGCVATVYILADQIEDTDGTGTIHQKVLLRGNADAIFSRGLLCLLDEYLQELTLDQVLHLDPMEIADVLGVRPALSKGRNDGLANMLKIIQSQLLKENDETSGIEPKVESDSSTTDKKATVALLLSGGVDSSVAFRLLLEQGYDVVPFYLKIWLEDELAHLGECPWEDDVNTCRQVCDQVGVDLQIISLQEEYHQRVMQHTLNECSLGRTPNPDILCNSRVKFGCFLEYLKGLPNQYDYIASGHYAQVKRTFDDEGASIAKLFRAPDPVKDQSYFLCALDQAQLSRLLFPIGHLEKVQVRQLAEEFLLPNRHRPDSQGLCFLGKVKFRDFMQIHLGEKFGDIVDAVTGETIGKHHGVWYHTVGQRKGIGPYLIPQFSAKGPWYVVAKDPSNNVVYASNKYDEDVFLQARSEFHVENLHWISGSEPNHLKEDGTYRFILKIRHGPRLASGTLTVLEGEDKNSGGIIKLEERDGGLAPGQYVVFYTEEAECLGGGIISERHWAKFLLDREVSTEDTTTTV